MIIRCVRHLGKKKSGDVLCSRDINMSDEVRVERKQQKANGLSVVRLLDSTFNF